MNCDKCGKEANIEIWVYSSEKAKKIHLCMECYTQSLKEGGLLPDTGAADGDSGKGFKYFQEILSDLVSVVLDTDENKDDEQRCSFCGSTYHHIAKSGKFGCDNCYREFYENAKKSMMRTQGSDRHTGRTPKQYHQIRELKDVIRGKEDELKSMVRDEDYEGAAGARDELVTLRTELEEMRGKLHGGIDQR
jgi:protein arginine kinase activator